MNDNAFAQQFIRELEAETRATQRCLERMRMDMWDYKPHEKSMIMGYLALLCAEIPLWIAFIVKDPQIDLATFDHFHPKKDEDFAAHFLENVGKAKNALQQVQDGQLDAKFELKADGKVVDSSTKRETLESTINHMVHHRGQLTVYMKLNDIPIPSIYGPSADEKTF